MTYRPLTIGIDLNKVVLDTLGALHRLTCEIAGANIPPEQFAGKNVVGRWYPSHDDERRMEITIDHYERAKKVLFETSHFHECAKPLRGAVRALQVAYGYGHRAVLVTDAHHLDEGILRHWWRVHHLPQDCEKIFTRGGSKSDYYGLCDVVVDDDVANLLPLVEDYPTTELLHLLPAEGATGSAVIHRPAGVPARIVSVRSWDEVLAHLQEKELLAA